MYVYYAYINCNSLYNVFLIYDTDIHVDSWNTYFCRKVNYSNAISLHSFIQKYRQSGV